MYFGDSRATLLTTSDAGPNSLSHVIYQGLFYIPFPQSVVPSPVRKSTMQYVDQMERRMVMIVNWTAGQSAMMIVCIRSLMENAWILWRCQQSQVEYEMQAVFCR